MLNEEGDLEVVITSWDGWETGTVEASDVIVRRDEDYPDGVVTLGGEERPDAPIYKH